MALFSRRDLQRMLNENACFLGPAQILEHVRRLNIVRDDYLSTEWEITLLNAFSKTGTIKHEPDLGGKRYLDVVFKGENFEFAADIATVSDQQLHSRNPVGPLQVELARRVRKRKISSGGFRLDVGPHPDCVSKGRGTRHRLMLPPVSELGRVIFNRNFDKFLAKILEEPAKPREFGVHEEITDVRIRYEPSANDWGTLHPSYTCANVIDDNPVFNALKEKAKKLKLSNYEGPRGVFICDGGCSLLTTQMNNWAEYNLTQVVTDFFRQHQSIDFVITIGLRHDYSGRIGRGHYRLELQIMVHPRCFNINATLQATVERMMRHLPIPAASAENALARARAWPSHGTHYGGWQMTGSKKIRLSVITVLQLLAGELDYPSFAKAHGFDQPGANRFARALREGRVIERCSVEKIGDEDDDWITFEFSEADAAIHEFTNSTAAESR
jgi:hypothetical protein